MPTPDLVTSLYLDLVLLLRVWFARRWVSSDIVKYGPTSFKWDWECLRKFVDTSKNSPARVFARGQYSVFTYPGKPAPLPHRITVVFQHSPDYEDVPNIPTSGNSVGSLLHPSTFPVAFQETREQWPQLSDNEHPFSYDGACNPV